MLPSANRPIRLRTPNPVTRIFSYSINNLTRSRYHCRAIMEIEGLLNLAAFDQMPGKESRQYSIIFQANLVPETDSSLSVPGME